MCVPPRLDYEIYDLATKKTGSWVAGSCDLDTHIFFCIAVIYYKGLSKL